MSWRPTCESWASGEKGTRILPFQEMGIAALRQELRASWAELSETKA